jgi:hypothetical protein
MGIQISIFEGQVPRAPCDIELTLTCDACSVNGLDLFGPTTQVFRHREGFIGCYHAAMNAGWKDTNQRGEREFHGPCCSGKAVDTAYSAEVDD